MPGYWIDIVILGIIVLSILTGLVRGFVKELIALCIWIFAIWAAFSYSQTFSPWLEHYIHDATARTATSFVIILLLILIAGTIVSSIISFVLNRTGLSGTDKLLGMGFGFARGIFIVSLIMAVMKMTALPYQEFSSKSLLYAKFDPLVEWIYKVMPDILTKAKTMKTTQTMADFKEKITLG